MKGNVFSKLVSITNGLHRDNRSEREFDVVNSELKELPKVTSTFFKVNFKRPLNSKKGYYYKLISNEVKAELSGFKNHFPKDATNPENKYNFTVLYNKFDKYLKDIASYIKKRGITTNLSSDNDYIINYLKTSAIHLYAELQGVYIKNYRNAQIIQLYSFFEDILKRGCDRYASYKKTDYKVEDLKGNNDIDKVKKFLKQSAKVDFSVLNPEWSFIDNFRQVRNLVVHHKGIIKNNDTANNSDRKFNNIKNFSNGRFTLKPYVSSDNRFEIVFDNPEFFKEIIKNIENLLDKIGSKEMP
ncbi:DUF6617 family protein [Winogradskyella sp. PC D3.3]